MMQQLLIDTPFLPMILIADDQQLLKSEFVFDSNITKKYVGIPSGSNFVLTKSAKQLSEYFAGTRTEFDLPLKIDGTAFQKAVWNVLAGISYGTHLSYKEIAVAAGSPKAFRAAGGACRANHFAVIVPCHRVLATNGAPTGYAGHHSFMKENLLEFEARNTGQ